MKPFLRINICLGDIELLNTTVSDIDIKSEKLLKCLIFNTVNRQDMAFAIEKFMIEEIKRKLGVIIGN